MHYEKHRRADTRPPQAFGELSPTLRKSFLITAKLHFFKKSRRLKCAHLRCDCKKCHPVYFSNTATL